MLKKFERATKSTHQDAVKLSQKSNERQKVSL